MAYKTSYDSPLGRLTISSDGERITGLWIEQQKYFERTLEADNIERDDLEVFRKAKQWLTDYFHGAVREIDFELCPKGTKFQQKVWNILREIPFGEVTTYKEIAQAIAESENRISMSAQAVGGAVGHNPIAILIPCHRVVGSDGSMTGYAGGIEKKKYLLELEKSSIIRSLR